MLIKKSFDPKTSCFLSQQNIQWFSMWSSKIQSSYPNNRSNAVCGLESVKKKKKCFSWHGNHFSINSPPQTYSTQQHSCEYQSVPLWPQRDFYIILLDALRQCRGWKNAMRSCLLKLTGSRLSFKLNAQNKTFGWKSTNAGNRDFWVHGKAWRVKILNTEIID